MRAVVREWELGSWQIMPLSCRAVRARVRVTWKVRVVCRGRMRGRVRVRERVKVRACQHTLHGLAEVICGVKRTTFIVTSDNFGVNVEHIHVAVCCVVVTRFVKTLVSQPPWAAVGCPPRAVFIDRAFHSIIRATPATIFVTRYIYEQVRVSGIIFYIFPQRIVHEGPIVLVAR